MGAKARTTGAGLLVALGTLLAILSIFGVWAQRQVLENDKWVDTSEHLLESKALRLALSDYLVEELYANVDVQKQIADQLPRRLQPLAGVAAGTLREAVERAAYRLLSSARVLKAWRGANSKAQREFIAIVKDQATAVRTGGGDVRLDLRAILGEVGGESGLATKVAAKLPPQAASLLIMRSDQLEAGQTVINSLRPLAFILLFLSLACFGGSIALARNRRKALLTAGSGIFFAGVAVLALRHLGGSLIVDKLANPATEDAVSDVWSIGTSLLVEAAEGALLLGALTMLAAWVAGPGKAATATRRVLAPFMRNQPALVFLTLGLLILALVAWGPVPWTQRLVPVLIVAAAAFAGLEYLRRRTVAEFPAAD
jgi:hypothetical protein